MSVSVQSLLVPLLLVILVVIAVMTVRAYRTQTCPACRSTIPRDATRFRKCGETVG